MNGKRSKEIMKICSKLFLQNKNPKITQKILYKSGKKLYKQSPFYFYAYYENNP